MTSRISAKQFMQLVRHNQADILDAFHNGRLAYNRWEPLVKAFLWANYENVSFSVSGTLRGVTIGVKDLIDVRGMPTTAGSNAYHFSPPQDAIMVQRLRQQGAIITGKTNTQELAYGVITPPTRNPWNPKFIPGGSSGGSAVAVATGMVQIGLGTDTGGSIRIPASCCGVIGFKPSYGRISLQGVMPLSYTLDHAGILAGTTEDIEEIFLAVQEPLNLSQSPQSKEGSALKKKLAVPLSYIRHHADRSVVERFSTLLERFQDRGWHVDSIDMPLWQTWKHLQLSIRLPEAYHIHRDILESERRTLLKGDLADRLLMGKTILAHDYVAALRQREILIQQWQAILHDFDGLIMPTLPVPPPAIGCEEKVTINGAQIPTWDAMVVMTAPWNVVGFPAISLPWYYTEDSIPMGIQFVSTLYADDRLLQLARSVQDEILDAPKSFPDWDCAR